MTAEEYDKLTDNDLTRYLCSALPHGLTVETPDGRGHLLGILFDAFKGPLCVVSGKTKKYQIGDVKPVLRKIEDLTTEECDQIFAIFKIDDKSEDDWIKINDAVGIMFYLPTGRYQEDVVKFYDWCYEHKVDSRYLIEQQLAVHDPKIK